jgi:ComF family protein
VRLRDFFQAVIEALYPNVCLACEKLFRLEVREPFQQEGLKSFYLERDGHVKAFHRYLYRVTCLSCLQDFEEPASPFCTCCGQMFKSSEGVDHLCENCLTSPMYFEKARAAGIYSGTLMTLIHRFKYQKKLQLALPFQQILIHAWLHNFDLNSRIIVVPIPLHLGRLRSRGFNQAHLMVNRWNEMLDQAQIRYAGIKIVPDLLIRKKKTMPQTGLSKSRREQNIRDAFEVTGPSFIKDQRVLLVDDVYTTGSTANECARVLKGAGAFRVDVLTLARTM